MDVEVVRAAGMVFDPDLADCNGPALIHLLGRFANS